MGKAQPAIVDAAPQMKQRRLVKQRGRKLSADGILNVADIFLVRHIRQTNSDQNQLNSSGQPLDCMLQPLDASRIQPAQIDHQFAAIHILC